MQPSMSPLDTIKYLREHYTDLLIKSVDDLKYVPGVPQHDSYISRRHRMYGAKLIASDIDFPLIEMDGLTPAAIIDYKRSNCNAGTLAKIKNVSYTNTLATMAGIVGLTVLYSVDNVGVPTYYLFDGNQKALETIRAYYKAKINDVSESRGFVENWKDKLLRLSEKEYVAFLYFLRGQTIPDDLTIFGEKKNEVHSHLCI